MSGRVFVIGTGRCGTCTFYHAIRHATNKTAGHESVYWRPDHRHDYPENHIEVGHTLTWVLAWLVKRYPEARFVHLQREREACIESLIRNGLGPLRLFHRINRGEYLRDERAPIDREMAELYYDETVARINALLRRSRGTHVWLEQVPDVWRYCWEFMGLRGDFDASLGEWGRRYNAGGIGRDNFTEA